MLELKVTPAMLWNKAEACGFEDGTGGKQPMMEFVVSHP
jgi:hypothetical protein